MALTYQQSADLMHDPVFQGRVKVAGLNFATYILGEAPSVAGHTSRYRWAQQMGLQPDMISSQIQPLVVMDPNVQANGSDVLDSDLQTAVETVVNKLF